MTTDAPRTSSPGDPGGERVAVNADTQGRRFPYGGAPPPVEPATDPIFMRAIEVIGWIAYGRMTALEGEPPDTSFFFERWRQKPILGGDVERRHPAVRALRAVIVRAQWWQRNRRRGFKAENPLPIIQLQRGLVRVVSRSKAARPPQAQWGLSLLGLEGRNIPPVHRIERGLIRWAMRNHGCGAQALLKMLQADLRQYLAADAEHEIAVAKACHRLTAEGAAGNIAAVAISRHPGARPLSPGDHQPVPADVFANPNNTITPDGVAGRKWCDLKFKRAEVLRLWPAVVAEPAMNARSPLVSPSERTSEPSIELTPPKRTASKATLDKWYEDRVAKWPKGKTHPGVDDDLKAAAAAAGDLGDVTRERIRELRGRLAPETWKVRGTSKKGRGG